MSSYYLLVVFYLVIWYQYKHSKYLSNQMYLCKQENWQKQHTFGSTFQKQNTFKKIGKIFFLHQFQPTSFFSSKLSLLMFLTLLCVMICQYSFSSSRVSRYWLSRRTIYVDFTTPLGPRVGGLGGGVIILLYFPLQCAVSTTMISPMQFKNL